MGLTLDRQIEIITGYKNEIHDIAEKAAFIVQKAEKRLENQKRDFHLTDDELQKISIAIGKISTNLSLMAAFSDNKTKLLILDIMEMGAKAYFLLRTSARAEAIGSLDAWFKVVQSIIPDFTKRPFRFKISAQFNVIVAKIRGLFEKDYGKTT